MTMKLTHVIKFVSNMDQAVAFHRDVLGLPLKFASPGWSEFGEGETTLALHPASAEHPAGTAQPGYEVPNLDAFYGERERLGLTFTSPPVPLHGVWLAHFLDLDGAECSISSKA